MNEDNEGGMNGDFNDSGNNAVDSTGLGSGMGSLSGMDLQCKICL
jgi:hypothetical protein